MTDQERIAQLERAVLCLCYSVANILDRNCLTDVQREFIQLEGKQAVKGVEAQVHGQS